MTAKEKAQELVKKYLYYFPEFINEKEYDYDYNKSKECALIAVNEIINSNPHSNPFNTEVYSTINFWQEVKHEIENL